MICTSVPVGSFVRCTFSGLRSPAIPAAMFTSPESSAFTTALQGNVSAASPGLRFSSTFNWLIQLIDPTGGWMAYQSLPSKWWAITSAPESSLPHGAILSDGPERTITESTLTTATVDCV